MDEAKERIRKSIYKYSAKNDPVRKKTQTTKNKKPEDEVVKAHREWFKTMRFSMTIVESKATFSVSANKYLHSQAEVGASDSYGNDSFGMAAYVEFKAKGKLSTLSRGQRLWLIEKIKTNAFACCSDSVGRTESYYREWRMLVNANRSHHAREWLMSALPTEPKNQIEDDLSDLM